MGFFDHDVDNAFDRMFDFNHDGQNDMIENAMKWQFFSENVLNDNLDDEKDPWDEDEDSWDDSEW